MALISLPLNYFIVYPASVVLYGLPREAIAFVGDRLYTDVACGTQNGACGILVMTGETTPEMLAESSFSPDAVFPSLGAMAPLL